jgi:hypothetical protein
MKLTVAFAVLRKRLEKANGRRVEFSELLEVFFRKAGLIQTLQGLRDFLHLRSVRVQGNLARVFHVT